MAEDWTAIVKTMRAEGATARTAHCLANLGCKAIEDAAQFSRSALLSYPNLGRTTLNEIVERLEQRGLHLKAETVAPIEERLARALGRVNATKYAYETARKALDELMKESGTEATPSG